MCVGGVLAVADAGRWSSSFRQSRSSASAGGAAPSTKPDAGSTTAPVGGASATVPVRMRSGGSTGAGEEEVRHLRGFKSWSPARELFGGGVGGMAVAKQATLSFVAQVRRHEQVK